MAAVKTSSSESSLTDNIASKSQLTAKQRSILQEFRVNVASILRPDIAAADDDDYLLRWLRAREWDLQKAEKMLRSHLEWRVGYDLDKLLQWNPPEVLQKYCRGSVFGCDKEGHPIYVELLGKADFKGIFLSATKKDILRFRTYILEEIVVKIFPVCSQRVGKKIDQFSVLFDMEGVGYKHLWKPLIDTVLEWLPIIEGNYPEVLHACYIINAPSVFPVLFNLVKPFLREHTLAKVRILGSNWKQSLLKDIDVNQLPIQFGGTRSTPLDGDPFIPLPEGGVVPESYYLKSATTNIDMSQFTTATVGAGGSLEIEVEVDKPNSVLSWNFWTNTKDVAFAVYQKVLNGSKSDSKSDNMETVVANSRVNSHMVPEAGSVQCCKTGTYVIRFDNSYSWMSSKKLSYHIEVLQPDATSDALCLDDSPSSEL